VANVPGLHHLGDSPHRILDWDLRIAARGAIDVDMVDAQGAAGNTPESSSRPQGVHLLLTSLRQGRAERRT